MNQLGEDRVQQAEVAARDQDEAEHQSRYFGPTPVMLAMRVPYVGALSESMALSRLTWALAMGLDAGIDAKRGSPWRCDLAESLLSVAKKRQPMKLC